MIAYDEIRNLEQQIRAESRRESRDMDRLKSVLARGLAEFDRDLAALPSKNREVARRLYMEKVREITCLFHSAVVRLSSINDGSRYVRIGQDDDSELFAALDRVGENLNRVKGLYELQ